MYELLAWQNAHERLQLLPAFRGAGLAQQCMPCPHTSRALCSRCGSEICAKKTIYSRSTQICEKNIFLTARGLKFSRESLCNLYFSREKYIFVVSTLRAKNLFPKQALQFFACKREDFRKICSFRAKSIYSWCPLCARKVCFPLGFAIFAPIALEYFLKICNFRAKSKFVVSTLRAKSVFSEAGFAIYLWSPLRARKVCFRRLCNCRAKSLFPSMQARRMSQNLQFFLIIVSTLRAKSRFPKHDLQFSREKYIFPARMR